MNFATIGASVWGGLKKVPDIVWWIVIAIFTLRILEMWWRSDESNKQKMKQQVETAKEREVVLDTSRKEIDNVEDAKDAAIAAPDSLPEFTSADELRDEAPAIAEVILRSRRGDQ